MSKTRLAALIAVVVVAVQALLVPLFAGPAAHLAPRDLPLAIAGPAPAAAQLADQLTAARPGAFDLRVLPAAAGAATGDAATASGSSSVATASGGSSVAAADAAIRNREVYGAIVLGPTGPSLHVATAAGPAVATLLTQAATELGRGAPVPIVDVVPTDPDDPRGSAFGAAFLPLAMTGLLAGVLTFLLVQRRRARLVALGTYAVLAGFAGAAVQQAWLGVLPGDYLSVAAVLALFGLAVSATVAGLAAVFDRAGLALGALLVFLVGNALSGVSSAAELLPQPWGAVGQALPIGAGSTLLRSVAYFDGNGAGVALAVLTAYGIGGLVLVAAGRRGLSGSAAQVAPEPERLAVPVG